MTASPTSCAHLPLWIATAAVLLAFPAVAQDFEGDFRRDRVFKDGQQADGPPKSLLSLPPRGRAADLGSANEGVDPMGRDPDPLLEPEDPLLRDPLLGPAATDGLADADDELLPGEVLVDELTDSDIAAIGVLTAETGGLPPALWQGTPMRDAINAVTDMPDVGTPALQALARRLLLTAGAPPDGGEGRGWDFMEARLAELARGGRLADLLLMFDALPDEDIPATLAQLRAETYLLAGDFASACIQARAAVEDDRSGYWLELIAACRALEGDRYGAELALDILAEGGRRARFLRDLVDRAANPALLDSRPASRAEALEWPEEVAVTPLLFALGQIVGVAPPQGLAATGDGLLLAALALSSDVPPRGRLAAAENAATTGAVRSDHLREVMVASDVGVIRRTDDPAAERARRFQHAADAANPAVRYDALVAVWRSAEEDGTWAAIAPATAALLVPLDASPRFVERAPAIVRSLALAGEMESAIDWYSVVRAAAQSGRQADVDRLLEVWAIAVVASRAGEVPFSDRILSLWYQGHMAAARTSERAESALLFFSVLEGLGYTVPPAIWQQLGGFGPDLVTRSPAGPAWNKMVTAASESRIGETVAYAITALGDDGSVGAEPETLRAVLESLRKVGLDRDARRIAAEALILRGF